MCVCVSQRECVTTLKIWKRSEKEWKRKTHRQRKRNEKIFQQTFQNENEKRDPHYIIEVGSRRALSIKRTSINHDAPHERREEE